MNLNKKLELNNRHAQLTSGNSCRKAGQNYLPPDFGGKNAEKLWSSEKQSKGIILRNQKFKNFFVV